MLWPQITKWHCKPIQSYAPAYNHTANVLFSDKWTIVLPMDTIPHYLHPPPPDKFEKIGLKYSLLLLINKINIIGVFYMTLTKYDTLGCPGMYTHWMLFVLPWNSREKTYPPFVLFKCTGDSNLHLGHFAKFTVWRPIVHRTWLRINKYIYISLSISMITFLRLGKCMWMVQLKDLVFINEFIKLKLSSHEASSFNKRLFFKIQITVQIIFMIHCFAAG